MTTLLTDKQIKSITDIGRHLVAPSLFLVITPNGGKNYHARVTLSNGKRSWRSLGSIDSMTVKQARTKALQITETQVDPVTNARTFKTCFDEYVSMNKSSWKNESSLEQWNQTFNTYINPKIGHLKIDEIRPFHIADLLKPIWLTKSETARRIRGRVKTVIDYELARLGLMQINPAETRFIGNLLPKQKYVETHFNAPTLDELKRLFQSLNDKSTSHLALKWTILHVCRTTETREATHDEIHGDVWVIPKERMKNGVEHIVPIVGDIPTMVNKSNLLFPYLDKPLSINGMRSVLQKRKITWTVHGIRSCFRSWCQENGIGDRVAEECLAHMDDNKTQRAYARSNLLNERRLVLIKWKETLDAT
jgi:integrase